jgi:hypothetical protein
LRASFFADKYSDKTKFAGLFYNKWHWRLFFDITLLGKILDLSFCKILWGPSNNDEAVREESMKLLGRVLIQKNYNS